MGPRPAPKFSQRLVPLGTTVKSMVPVLNHSPGMCCSFRVKAKATVSSPRESPCPSLLMEVLGVVSLSAQNPDSVVLFIPSN